MFEHIYNAIMRAKVKEYYMKLKERVIMGEITEKQAEQMLRAWFELNK